VAELGRALRAIFGQRAARTGCGRQHHYAGRRRGSGTTAHCTLSGFYLLCALHCTRAVHCCRQPFYCIKRLGSAFSPASASSPHRHLLPFLYRRHAGEGMHTHVIAYWLDCSQTERRKALRKNALLPYRAARNALRYYFPFFVARSLPASKARAHSPRIVQFWKNVPARLSSACLTSSRVAATARGHSLDAASLSFARCSRACSPLMPVFAFRALFGGKRATKLYLSPSAACSAWTASVRLHHGGNAAYGTGGYADSFLAFVWFGFSRHLLPHRAAHHLSSRC